MECRSFPKTEPRQKLLAALFTKARDLGIEGEDLRENIAPEVIKKRLSDASSQELFKVLEHITGLYKKAGYQKYESSKAGLLIELEDAARARWGEAFKEPLLKFINSHRARTVTHYKWLNVAYLKEFKNRIKELNRSEGIS